MSIFKHDCKIHGHRFEARYSGKDNTKEIRKLWAHVHKMENENTRLLFSKINTNSQYHYDICTKCGKIIKRMEQRRKKEVNKMEKTK